MRKKRATTGLWIFFAAVIFCALRGVLSAETVSYESALVWRHDGRGDYPLAAPAPGVCSAGLGVETKGIIRSMTALWKSEGDVRLEVSADGGLHYTRATNGVPLREGFTPGTTLTWRAALAEDAALEEVKICYADSSGVAGCFGNPALAGFRLRKSFRISGSKGASLRNHQVRVNIGESSASEGADLFVSGIKPDFSDIRFVLPDGETILPFFLEKITGVRHRRTAHFFLKVPEIPAEGISLYAYYGNPAAQAASDADATFDFYDDFSGSALDKKWTVSYSPGGTIARTAGGLFLDGAAVVSRTFRFKEGMIEYSATAETGFETRLVIRDADPLKDEEERNDDAVSTSFVADEEADIFAYSSAHEGAEHCIATGSIVRANVASRIAPLARYDYRLILDAGLIMFERYAQDFAQRQATVAYKDAAAPRKGHFGFATSWQGRGMSISRLHWVRVRKYARPEPSVEQGSVGREEPLATGRFMNLDLAANGDLVLSRGKPEGFFATQEMPHGSDVRILGVAWKGEGVVADVSADGGKNYLRHAGRDAFYYAAKGDFVKGSRLVSCVHFGGKTKGGLARLAGLTLQHAPGKIVVLSPNGGETGQAGRGCQIRWTAWDYERTYPVKIEYSPDAGQTFYPIAQRLPNTGAYLWRVPPAASSSQALIRVCDGYDASVCDVSDEVFSISDASLKET